VHHSIFLKMCLWPGQERPTAGLCSLKMCGFCLLRVTNNWMLVPGVAVVSLFWIGISGIRFLLFIRVSSRLHGGKPGAIIICPVCSP